MPKKVWGTTTSIGDTPLIILNIELNAQPARKMPREKVKCCACNLLLCLPIKNTMWPIMCSHSGEKNLGTIPIPYNDFEVMKDHTLGWPRNIDVQKEAL